MNFMDLPGMKHGGRADTPVYLDIILCVWQSLMVDLALVLIGCRERERKKSLYLLEGERGIGSQL
jgi:hypothetical protein